MTEWGQEGLTWNETGKTIKVCQKKRDWWWRAREFIKNWVIKNILSFLWIHASKPCHVCDFYSLDWVRRHQQGRSGDVFCYQLQRPIIPQPRSSCIHSGWDLHRGLTSAGPEGVRPRQPPCYWHMSFQVLGSYSLLHLARLLLLEEPTSTAILLPGLRATQLGQKDLSLSELTLACAYKKMKWQEHIKGLSHSHR